MGRLVSTAFVIAVIWASGCSAELGRHKPKPHHEDCPPCQGRDVAPSPGDFNFYFLVRYVFTTPTVRRPGGCRCNVMMGLKPACVELMLLLPCTGSGVRSFATKDAQYSQTRASPDE